MKKLQIPENISLRNEIWRGFGVPEAIKTVPISVAALLLTVLLCQLIGSDAAPLAATAVTVFTIAFCIGFFSKLDGNQSIYDFFVRQARYRKAQQGFLYRKKDEVITIV